MHFQWSDCTYFKSTFYLISFLAGLDQGPCFPNEWKHAACPPLQDVRIIGEIEYDRTSREDYHACWRHCKELWAGLYYIFMI